MVKSDAHTHAGTQWSRMFWRLGLTILAFVVAGTAAPTLGASGSISGNVVVAPASVDLTAVGSIDWVHWGYAPVDVDRMAGGNQVSDWSSINGGDPGATTIVGTSYSWTNGIEGGEVISSSKTGLRVFAVGKGLRITVLASTTLRRLKFYVGATKADGELTAKLEGVSNYVATVSSSTGTSTKEVTIDFRAASSGKKLTVDYIVKTKYPTDIYQSWISLESAALQSPGGSGGATLTGSLVNAPSSVNLTDLGTVDWVHWGRIPDAPIDRKDGVNLISGLLDPPHHKTKSVSAAYSWSDGEPPNSDVIDTKSGLWRFAVGKGFEFTSPADTTLRTLAVYLGANAAKGILEATLSDGSAPKFTTPIDQPSGKSSRVVTLTYRAASAGQTLRIRYVLDKIYQPF